MCRRPQVPVRATVPLLRPGGNVVRFVSRNAPAGGGTVPSPRGKKNARAADLRAIPSPVGAPRPASAREARDDGDSASGGFALRRPGPEQCFDLNGRCTGGH